MLIFKDANGHQNQQYVAHVGVRCTSRRVKKQQFTFEAFLTCQRFTYFPLEEVNFQSVLQTFLNIRVSDEWASSPDEAAIAAQYSKDELTEN